MNKLARSGALLMALGMVSVAAEPTAPPPKKAVVPAKKTLPVEWLGWLRTQLSQERVFGLVNEALAQTSLKKSSAFEMLVVAGRLQEMSEYPFFEYDTNLNRAWLSQFAVAMTRLAGYRSERDRQKPGTPEFNRLTNLYEDLAAKIKAAFGNPEICRDKALIRKQKEAKELALERLRDKEGKKKANDK